MDRNSAFGASELELSWESTPAVWMATLPGLCWCEDCRGKHVKGFGKTKDEAVADFNENQG